MNTQQQRDEEVISSIGNKTDPIPLDLKIEILKRLPVKSLLKFKCVSKQWYSIIRSRSFTDYIMSLSAPRLLLGYDIHNDDESRLFFLSSLLLPQDSNHSSMVSKHNIPDLKISHFCNYVNGIFLWSLLDDRYLICNPTTRQVLEIPNDVSGFDTNYKDCYMCLGYDPKKDQYKILRRMVSKNGSVIHSVCTLERGQQSSFSSWRHVESNFSYYHVYYREIYINGVMYYEAGIKQSNKKRYVIESFDVGSERLLLIEAPQEFELKPRNRINYQGKLAFFMYKTDDRSCYTLWVLDDVEKQIWSNKTDVFPPSACYFSLPNFIPMVCGTTNAGEIVFQKQYSLEFFIYNLQEKKVTARVKFGAIRDHLDEHRPCPSNVVRHISTSCDHVDNIIIF